MPAEVFRGVVSTGIAGQGMRRPSHDARTSTGSGLTTQIVRDQVVWSVACWPEEV